MKDFGKGKAKVTGSNSNKLSSKSINFKSNGSTNASALKRSSPRFKKPNVPSTGSAISNATRSLDVSRAQTGSSSTKSFSKAVNNAMISVNGQASNWPSTKSYSKVADNAIISVKGQASNWLSAESLSKGPTNAIASVKGPSTGVKKKPISAAFKSGPPK